MSEEKRPHGQIIIIGASAGGLEPLQTIFSQLPADFSIPIVVVRHSLPSRPSLLTDVLGASSNLAVRTIKHDSFITPAAVHVVPSSHNVAFKAAEDGEIKFVLVEQERELGPTPNIDLTIVSAAQHFGSNCTAVILSGYLDDGTEGAKFLAKVGGTTIVQSPDDAQHDSMPLNIVWRDSPEHITHQQQIAKLLLDLEHRAAHSAA